MSQGALSAREARPLDVARAGAVAGYAIFGAILVSTRTVGLGRSYWHDEILTVVDYVRGGPRVILTGPYLPNNHELFSLLGWATHELGGNSEAALRLWSVVPFLLGVAVVTVWLHIRVGALAAILFLFVTAASPLLLDITRQARGYGLAWLAMSVVVVSALEVVRGANGWWLAAFFAAGTVGAWTLVNFGTAFLGIAAIFLFLRPHRQATAIGLAIWALLLASWYAPHAGELVAQSRQDVGPEIGLPWLVTAPIDQILLPALIWVDGVALQPGIVWLPLVAVAVVLMLQSPLLGDRKAGLVLLAGPVATVAVLWFTSTREVPRFLSFLTVPLFILLATGIGRILAHARGRRSAPLGAFAVAALLLLGVSLTHSIDVVRLPREAHKEAASLIQSEAPGTVYAHMAHPSDLAFYLGSGVLAARFVTNERVCSSQTEVALVDEPWDVRPLAISCLDRLGVRHYRFEQYTRGHRIEVWLIPPSTTAS